MATATLRKTPKQVRRFRCKIGESYARLDTDLHEKGVLVKCSSVMHAHVFNRNLDAGNAISRTLQLQGEIGDSMFPQWKKFDPIRYPLTPTVEEFSIEEPHDE